jgi:hypothetical protein
MVCAAARARAAVLAVAAAAAAGTHATLPQQVHWQWQLDDFAFPRDVIVDTAAETVTLYDVDLFTTSAADMASLKAIGKKVACYFEAGTVRCGGSAGATRWVPVR